MMPGRVRTEVERTFTRDELEGMMRKAAQALGARLPPRINIAVRPLAEAYFRTTARGSELRVVVNDAFANAPTKVLEAMAEVIVARATRTAKPRSVGAAFWEYVGTEALKGRMMDNYLARQRSFDPDPEGSAWNLLEVFDIVNEASFEGGLPRPMLGWTLRPITYRWGWYSSMITPHGLIVVNRLLDDPRVPAFVVEGTMYHEMLHILLDPEVVNGRRVVHTRRFRDMERRYDRYEELRPEYRRILRRYGREDGDDVTRRRADGVEGEPSHLTSSWPGPPPLPPRRGRWRRWCRTRSSRRRRRRHWRAPHGR